MDAQFALTQTFVAPKEHEATGRRTYPFRRDINPEFLSNIIPAMLRPAQTLPPGLAKTMVSISWFRSAFLSSKSSPFLISSMKNKALGISELYMKLPYIRSSAEVMFATTVNKTVNKPMVMFCKIFISSKDHTSCHSSSISTEL